MGQASAKRKVYAIENMEKFYSNNKDLIKEKHKRTEFDYSKLTQKREIPQLNAELRNCGVLIVTANQVEHNTVTNLLFEKIESKETDITRYVADGFNYQIAAIPNCSPNANNRATVKVAHIQATAIGSFSKGGSADAVEAALKRFTPNLVVSLGCAYGIDPENQNFGDVLVSKEIISCADTAKRTNKKIRFSNGSPHHISDKLLPYLNAGPQITVGEINYSVNYGTMLSGYEVLSDLEEKMLLEQAVKAMNERKLIGGEMEGSGIIRVCEKHKKSIPWLVIKGICDWGMEKNAWVEIIRKQQACGNPCIFDMSEDNANGAIKDSIQAIATENAFATLMKLFDTNPMLAEKTFSIEHLSSSIISLWKHSAKSFFQKTWIRSTVAKCLSILFGFGMIWVGTNCLLHFGYLGETWLGRLLYQHGDLIRNFLVDNPLISYVLSVILFFAGIELIYQACRVLPVFFTDDIANFEFSFSSEGLTATNESKFDINQVEILWMQPSLFHLWTTLEKQLPKIDKWTHKQSQLLIEKSDLKQHQFSVFQITYFTDSGICYSHLITPLPINGWKMNCDNPFSNGERYSETIFLCDKQIVPAANRLRKCFSKFEH